MRLPAPHTPFQDKYQLEDILGEGGFAIVYRALDVRAQRTVAIKILKPEGDGYSEGTESRFMREVRVLAQLRDPHTITLFEFGQTPQGLLFMVFEFVPGRDLADLLTAAHRLDERASVHIMRQVLKSLREAHENGLLHRDIKPENIRVFEYMGDPLSVKVLDFGIARAAQVEKGITQTGAAIGTPRYMSPEQTLGADLSPASDLYSVGLLVYEMLVGRKLVDEVNQPREQLKRLTSQRSIELPPDLVVSTTLRNVLHTMLKVQSQERFQTVSEVIRALDGEERPAPFEMLDTMQAEEPRANSTLIERFATADTGIQPVASPTHGSTTETAEPASGGSLVALAAGLVVVFGLLLGGLLLLKDEAPVESEPKVVDQPVVAIVEAAPDLGPAEPALPDLGAATDVGSDAAIAEPNAPVKTGCGADPPTKLTHESREIVGFSTIRWTTRLPKRYDPAKRHGVVVLLHNSWQSATGFRRQSKFESVADREGLIIVSPAGDEAANPWMLPESVELVDTVLARAERDFCTDPEAVYIVGFGAGGRLAERMVCESERKLGAIATIDFRAEERFKVCKPKEPVPYIMLNGKENGWNPVEGGEPCVAKGFQNFLELPAKVALDEHEQMWRDRNQCGEKVRRFGQRGKSVCEDFECVAAPFAACRLDSGLVFDIKVPKLIGDPNACNGRVARYPVAKTIWKFFQSHAPISP